MKDFRKNARWVFTRRAKCGKLLNTAFAAMGLSAGLSAMFCALLQKFGYFSDQESTKLAV